ncbi:unnamed protein product [Lymnaea stagnalis]|uniref:Uncharacterized protein n=1 Tax=Lymnaea stagnalis TaxID=6523 RepID=A0AAV2I2P0_LYMST
MKRETFICVLFLGWCVAQPHAGLDPVSIECFHCDTHARHFPACLSEPVRCHADEVCSIAYGNDLPSLKCQKSPDCDREVTHHVAPCEGGGVEIHPNQCQLCCKTSACVQEINRFLQQKLPTVNAANQGVFCPGTCRETDIATCVHTATYCHADQFCRVGINDQLMVAGHCQNKHDLQKCHDDQARHPCALAVSQPGHQAVCTWDCCQTTDCLTAHFGAYMGISTISHTASPTQTPPPAVTQAPATTPAPATTLAPAATPAHVALTPHPVNCTKCDQYCRSNEMEVTCPDGFCSLTVEDGVGGSRTIKKGCLNKDMCTMFWTEWNTNQLCHGILGNPATTSNQDVSCTFCCTGDNCNADLTKMSVFNSV